MSTTTHQTPQRDAGASDQPGSVQPARSDAVGSVQPGTCDGCHEPNDYVLTLAGGVHLCRGCLESEHPNEKVSASGVNNHKP